MTDTWLVAKKIDAFTEAPYAGNPAGVVAAPATLTDRQMQAMAREMNLSETVFVAADPVGEADHRLRYFTPTVEVPICGHATIAALHHLHDLETVHGDDPSRTFRLSTRVGVLAGHVEKGVAWTTFDRTGIDGVWDEQEVTARALVGGDQMLAPGARPVLFSDRNVAIEAKDVATLDALRPDLDALRRLQEGGLDGLIVFALRGVASGVTWHQRYFAPGYGIPEDPVTGLASARVATLLARLGHFRPHADGTVTAKVRQGDALGRPGTVHVRLRMAADGTVEETQIGGAARQTLEGRILVPPP